MKRIIILIIGFMLIGATVFAGSGDLIVNGNLGVGTTSPEYKYKFVVYDAGDSAPIAAIWAAGNTSERFRIQRVGQTSPDFIVTGGTGQGNVGIGMTSPSERLHVAGNIYATGTITPSDAKFKTNINPIGSALNTVTKLHGVSYNWKTEEFKDKGFSEGTHYGVIAQEIEKVLPDVVRTDPNGDKAVAYNEIIPILIEAIKEQQKTIEAQQNKIDKLEQQQAMISALYEKVNALEKQMKLQGTVARVDY